MTVFDEMSTAGHEQVLFCRNASAGLAAIIAIHNTELGPSLGGVRFYPYTTKQDAIQDVLRLSRSMTYKAALAGVDLGGGAAVIVGEQSIKKEALFRSFGRHVDSLNGRFIAAPDMNCTGQDMNWIRRETAWVAGHSESINGTGNPASNTAWGVYNGIRACLENVYGSPDVSGRTIAIQGVGSVGYHLAKVLHDAGAILKYADISERRLRMVTEEFGGKIVNDEVYVETPCDVLAPCAFGGILNPDTIPRIRAPIIAGSANNQLADESRDSAALDAAGLTYAPDYVINSGGLIQMYAELNGHCPDLARQETTNIYHTMKHIIATAQSSKLNTIEASNQIAEKRIESVTQLSSLFIPSSR